MRTTLTLDDDVADQLVERQRSTGMSYKEVVNAALRAGLQSGMRPVSALPPFRVTPKAGGFRAGVDVLHLNQLDDELESERFLHDLAKATAVRPPARRSVSKR